MKPRLPDELTTDRRLIRVIVYRMMQAKAVYEWNISQVQYFQYDQTWKQK